MIVFPVLIPVQNFLFPGTGRENLKCHGKGRDGKFEACIPGNHGKREFPLTPGLDAPSICKYNENVNVNIKVNANVYVEETSSHYINIEETSSH